MSTVVVLPKKLPKIGDIVFCRPIKFRPEIGIELEIDKYDCVGTLPIELAQKFVPLIRQRGRNIKFVCEIVDIKNNHTELKLSTMGQI